MEILGRVRPGRSYASTVMPLCSDELSRVLPFTPYPGTLNLHLHQPIALKNGTSWQGPDDGHERMLVPARLDAVDVYINRWSNCPYYRVDVMAPCKLREFLNLHDDSLVRLSIDDRYLDRRPAKAFIQFAVHRLRGLVV